MKRLFTILPVIMMLLITSCGGNNTVSGYVVGKKHTRARTERIVQPCPHPARIRYIPKRGFFMLRILAPCVVFTLTKQPINPPSGAKPSVCDMAKKATKPAAPEHTCRDCIHSTDWSNRGANGQFILCRCKFQKWCKFLDHDYCNNFKKR